MLSRLKSYPFLSLSQVSQWMLSLTKKTKRTNNRAPTEQWKLWVFFRNLLSFLLTLERVNVNGVNFRLFGAAGGLFALYYAINQQVRKTKTPVPAVCPCRLRLLTFICLSVGIGLRYSFRERKWTSSKEGERECWWQDLSPATKHGSVTMDWRRLTLQRS